MKVCIVTSWFPTKKGPHIAPFVYDFANNLANYGLDVAVITTWDDDGESVSHEGQMTIYRIRAKIPLLSILRLCKKIQPDVIHVHAPTLFSSNAIIVAKIEKVPILATVHRGEIEPIPNALLSLLRKFTLRRFQKIIAVSHFSKSLAIAAGAEENNIIVIHNSCDETRFFTRDKLASRNKLNLPPEKRIILFVGNLIKRKGIYTLLESLRILNAGIFSNFLAVIIGRGEEQKGVELKITEYGLSDNIRPIGWCPEKDLAYYYNAADVFVLPSTMEGHSIAILEAMASGLPIVASNVEGNKESVENGINGLLFETGNQIMLAQKLATIFANEDLRNQISKINPKIYSEKFSMASHVKGYCDVYESLIRSNKK